MNTKKAAPESGLFYLRNMNGYNFIFMSFMSSICKAAVMVSS